MLPALAALLSLLLCQPLPVAAKTFRIGLITPPGHQWTEAAERFRDAIAERYHNEHSLLVYPSRQLGTEAQMLQLLQTGALDFAILTVSELSNRLPRFGALYAPYLVDNVTEASILLQSAAARELLTPLPGELGVIGVGYATAGMRHILSRDRLQTRAELAGIKIRITPFTPIRDFYQLLEAAPTPMPLSSVFDALANGQIDAIDMDLESIWKLRYYEYADTLLLSGHMMFPAVGLMSARSALHLPPALGGELRDMLAQELDTVLARYPGLEQAWRQQLAATSLHMQVADGAFFGPVGERWTNLWLRHAPQLTALRQAVRQQRQGATR